MSPGAQLIGRLEACGLAIDAPGLGPRHYTAILAEHADAEAAVLLENGCAAAERAQMPPQPAPAPLGEPGGVVAHRREPRRGRVLELAPAADVSADQLEWLIESLSVQLRAALDAYERQLQRDQAARGERAGHDGGNAFHASAGGAG